MGVKLSSPGKSPANDESDHVKCIMNIQNLDEMKSEESSGILIGIGPPTFPTDHTTPAGRLLI